MLTPITPSTNTATMRKTENYRSVSASSPADSVALQGSGERRRQPDRRNNRETLSDAERRRRADRRRPELLNAKTGKPERLNNALGHSINTKA